MRLTTMSRYGTRAVFDVAYHTAGFPVQVKDISSRQEIPMRYLEQIFNRLKSSEFIKSERGPAGGYILTKDPSMITVGDVIRAVKEPMNLVHCVAPEAENGNSCHRAEQCVTRPVWREAGRCVVSYLDSVTIASLCEDASKKKVRKDLGHQFDCSI